MADDLLNAFERLVITAFVVFMTIVVLWEIAATHLHWVVAPREQEPQESRLGFTPEASVCR
jgi:hypothetical protein